ncbi:Endonuclease/exonuclease/phosphatase [Sporodiniella umbellata]|nr:Endonuclease/exonuclease/phosphatase [Sporodiniella umbellata]
MRPPLIRNNWSDYKDDRLDYIEHYILPKYDVLVFQEAFAFASRRKDRLIKTARKMGFNYHVESPRKYPWQLGVDGGLLLLSRFPIRQSHRIEYPRGQHADWFSVKGALHALIELNPKRHLHIYTTHTQASYDLNNVINPGDTEIRLSQFKRLHEFIAQTSNGSHPVLIAGDLNIDAATHPKERPITERSKDSSIEYLQMVNTLKLENMKDLVYESFGYHPVTFGDYKKSDTETLVPAETVLTNSDQWMTVQSIDRLFWIDRNTSLLTPLRPAIEKFWVAENTEMSQKEKKDTKFTQISDHYGLSCNILV